jgi:hypothetical protein
MTKRLELWESEGSRRMNWYKRKVRALYKADEDFPLIKDLVEGYYDAIRPNGEGMVWEGAWDSLEGFCGVIEGFMEACRRYPNARLVIK